MWMPVQPCAQCLELSLMETGAVVRRKKVKVRVRLWEKAKVAKVLWEDRKVGEAMNLEHNWAGKVEEMTPTPVNASRDAPLLACY